MYRRGQAEIQQFFDIVFLKSQRHTNSYIRLFSLSSHHDIMFIWWGSRSALILLDVVVSVHKRFRRAPFGLERVNVADVSQHTVAIGLGSFKW